MIAATAMNAVARLALPRRSITTERVYRPGLMPDKKTEIAEDASAAALAAYPVSFLLACASVLAQKGAVQSRR
jgi:hypothetical protein